MGRVAGGREKGENDVNTLLMLKFSKRFKLRLNKVLPPNLGVVTDTSNPSK